MESLGARWPSEQIQCLDQGERRLEPTTIERFIIQHKRSDVFLLETATGRRIRATVDHPFLTPYGMVPLRKLQVGDNIAVVPFEGVTYEVPPQIPIVTSHTIRHVFNKYGWNGQTARFRIILRKLEDRGLLPLTYEHPKLPLLLKIAGMVFGDGSMNFIGARKDGIVHFSGLASDLENIRADLSEIGYVPSPIHWKITRIHYRGEERRYRHASFIVNASSLVVLLAALGVPVGRKVAQPYRVPRWLREAPRWQQRLFLAALFGAELTRPRARESRRGNFCAPVLSMNKAERLHGNAMDFLKDITRMLGDFDVSVSRIEARGQHISKAGLQTRYFELVIDSNSQNLLHLWSRVGFVYHRQKAALASVAAHYLALKQQALAKRREAVEAIYELHRRGKTHAQVHERVGSRFVNLRYVQAVVQRSPKETPPRIPSSFPSYEEFEQLATIGLEGSGVVWDAVESISPVAGVHTVYDFAVRHEDHNFIANGYIVSNCGVRLMKTDLTEDEVRPKLRELIAQLFRTIPCGVGMHGDIRYTQQDAPKVMTRGSGWAVSQGHGVPADLEHTESQGCLEGADPEMVSERAVKRGQSQLGTLGSGNHFLEVQAVETVFDEGAANVFGLSPGQVTVMIHSGSRGFGYQVCDDYLNVMERAMSQYGIRVPDRQLACAPINSEEGRRYLGAIRCAANFAWANRQCLMHLARGVFERVFGKSWEQLGMTLIYDVAHNIAKFERHTLNGGEQTVCVHRKGATRAFPPGHPEIPADYREVGQPVIIPGDMGRYSFLLVGTESAMRESFGTTCHGAGRVMSRTQAVKEAAGRSIEQELERQGIIVMGRGRKGIAEEQPHAYKDVNDVVEVVHNAGLAKRVARMRPLGAIKG